MDFRDPQNNCETQTNRTRKKKGNELNIGPSSSSFMEFIKTTMCKVRIKTKRLICNLKSKKLTFGSLFLLIFTYSVFSSPSYSFVKALSNSKKFGDERGNLSELLKLENGDGSIGGGKKILCYILLSPKRVKVGRIIKQTWGSMCDKLIFYGKFNNSDLPVRFIDAREGYRYLWGKTKAALNDLYINFNDFDWFLKADDDTFVIVENLRNFVSNLDSELPIWFGYKLKHKRMKKGYMSGGAGYVFSKESLTRVVELFNEENAAEDNDGQKCDIGNERGIEDLELGKCFYEAGVKSIDTFDSEGRERFLPLPITHLINDEIPFLHWIWRQAWSPIHTGLQCCSPDLITMHQVPPHEMKTIYYFLYNVRNETRNNLNIFINNHLKE